MLQLEISPNIQKAREIGQMERGQGVTAERPKEMRMS